MKPSSAKQKGRLFQQYVRDTLLEHAPSLEKDDIRSTSMGASGEDILLSPAARRIYPYSIECKKVEKLSIWAAIEQARENCEPEYTPLIIFSKNNEEAQVSMPLSYFMELTTKKQIRDASQIVQDENQELLERLDD